MVRAPCCAKEGLKTGPWSQEEDNILTSYIHQHGHSNWRALPKQAGLLRCGKSCRLRWANYLRPDIKRGNFSKDEEDTIIQLHQVLGNRWSAIAGKLPGRTDNEIKNVWHTRLKKRLPNYQNARISKGKSDGKVDTHQSETSSELSESFRSKFVSQPNIVSSPQQFSREMSSVTEVRDSSNVDVEDEQVDISSEVFNEIDESFWTDTFSTDGLSLPSDFPLSPLSKFGVESVDSKMYDGLDFWYGVFTKTDEESTNFEGIVSGQFSI